MVTPVEVMDHDAVAAALAAQAPVWPLGEGHGYHPRTFGFLVDETLRRITGGRTLREYWRTEFADPLALDVWIGLPPERVKEPSSHLSDEVSPPPKGDAFYTTFLTPSSLTARAFASPRGLHSVAAMNGPEARSASFGAFGGVGTARGLAKFYAMLACGGEARGTALVRTPDDRLDDDHADAGTGPGAATRNRVFRRFHARSTGCKRPQAADELWALRRSRSAIREPAEATPLPTPSIIFPSPTS